MTTEIKLTGRVRSMSIPTKKGTMLSFSVLCPENTEDLKRLMSRRVTLSIAEANGHDTQEVLPLPVVEAEKAPPQLIVIPGQPIGKPRQTQRDKWQQRPCVVQYRLFADRARMAAQGKIPDELEGVSMRFFFAMPNSWDAKKRLRYDGKPHESKPDLDNCVKSILDSLLDNDEIISRLDAQKFWTNGEPFSEVTFY